MSETVESVVVVGRDAPAWLAAAALMRSYSRTGLRVRVVELPPLRTSVDAYAAMPSLGSLHRMLGLEERIVFGACRGLPMVAQRFSNWAKGGAPYFLAYDDEPPPGGDLPFTQYWVKGAREGLRVAYGDFSLGVACARLGRVPLPAGPDDLISASYGYHLDALAYSELAKQFALRLGVERGGAGVRHIDTDGDRITGIDLADGTRLQADLFIDASGSEGLLIGKLSGDDFETWADWLPCNRVLAASAPRMPNLPAFSEISAFRGGWLGLFPMQHRTAVLAVYDTDAIRDQELAQQLALMARMPIQDDAIVSDLRRGIRTRPWIGNCVAIGEAAIALDPLGALDLHVAHACISHLITLFPASSRSFIEAEVYNRTVALFGSNLRDYQAVHYKLNHRFDDPFWDSARDASMPASFERRLETFRARALVTLQDEETFDEQSWSSLFLGCGVMPEGYDARLDLVPEEAHIGKVQARLREVALLAQQMPTVVEFSTQQPAAAQVQQ